MTTTTTKRFSFDRDEVAKFETPDGDDRNQVWLSPYAIPTDLAIGRTVDGLHIDVFYYGEEQGAEPLPLGDMAPPAVLVRHGRYTRKVMGIFVPLAAHDSAAAATPADAVPLVRLLADRLIAVAERRTHPAERLSLRLVGKLIRDVSSEMADAGRPQSDHVSAPSRNPNTPAG